jgi:hypothetical protein
MLVFLSNGSWGEQGSVLENLWPISHDKLALPFFPPKTI